MDKAKIKLNNGMILTITISHEDNFSIEGVDKFCGKVKIDKLDIATRIPVYDAVDTITSKLNKSDEGQRFI